jgi:hypothetical protein
LGEWGPAIEEGGADLEDLEDLRDLFYIVMKGVTFWICFKKSTVSHHMGVQRAFALPLGNVVDVT